MQRVEHLSIGIGVTALGVGAALAVLRRAYRRGATRIDAREPSPDAAIGSPLVLTTPVAASSQPGLTVRDLVRRFNRRILNPITLSFAGQPHRPYAIVRHVGRRSGRAYQTPVVADPSADGWIIPLPYGARVDWCRNVLAAGRCTLVRAGAEYAAGEPQIIDAATALPLLPPRKAAIFRRFGISQFLRLTPLAAPPIARNEDQRRRSAAWSARPSRQSMRAARGVLRRVWPRDRVATLLREAERQYSALTPTIPVPPQPGPRMSLEVARFTIALYRTLLASGMAREEATALLNDITDATVRPPQQVLDRVGAWLIRDPIRRVRWKARLERRVFFPAPAWLMREVAVPGGYGVDVQRCIVADYFRALGLGELCEQTFCVQDLRRAQRCGERLMRTGTLAGGADHCDFRYLPLHPVTAQAAHDT